MAKLAHLQDAPKGGPDWSGEIAALQAAIAKIEDGLSTFAGENEEDPHANVKFADLLSKHLKAAEKEADAAAQNLANLEQQLRDLKREIALKKRDTAAKAAANLAFQIMLRKRVDGTSQNASFARVVKEGRFKERMQAKALEAFSPEWKAQNGAALLSNEALYAFLARAQSFWVGIAEDAQKEMGAAESGDMDADPSADPHSDREGGADDEFL